MAPPRKRRLAAVWFADIVGYTRLSTQDEDAALSIVDELQRLSRDAAHGRGRIVKFLGDGVIAVFDSTSNALESAVELERSFAESEVVRRHDCSLSVGLHVGEVVEAEDGDIYGDGVNVASRIEGVAGARQILVSEVVHRQVRNRAEFETHPVGHHQMKGLDQPMRLYALGPAHAGPGDGSGAGASATTDVDPAETVPAGDWEPLPVGTVLNERYALEALLGRGGFGATYRASDRGRFGARCAVKELTPRAGTDPAAIARFEREARSLVDLRHDGIPRLHEFFRDLGRYFLVQELAEGRDLSALVSSEGPMSEERTVAVLIELLDILSYLHGRVPPVVHRDVKPGNIVLSQGGVKLVDFGAVRAAEPDDPTFSRIFTPGYAPQRQLAGKATPAADRFAAGATAVFLLTGESPKRLYDIERDCLTVVGRTPASERLEVAIETLTKDGGTGFRSAEDAKRALQAAVDAPPIAEGADRIIHEPGPDRRSRRVLVAGAGAAVAIGALAVTILSGPEPAASSDPLPELETAAVPAPALPLDGVARATTTNQWIIRIRYPVTWPVVSAPTDGHAAVRDPTTGGLFLAGLDFLEGLDVPPRGFVDRWTATTAANYAQVAVVSAEPQTGGSAAYRLDVVQGSQAVRQGVMFVTPVTDIAAGETLFRWWAALNMTEANAATFEEMARWVEALPAEG
jgi:serine/threonine protein kinase/class 3 adenylate cyclase